MITLWCFSIHFLSPLNIILPIPTTRKILYSTRLSLSLQSVDHCSFSLDYSKTWQPKSISFSTLYTYISTWAKERERERAITTLLKRYTQFHKKIFFSLNFSAFGSYSWHGSTELLPFHFHSILISRRSVKYEHTNTGKRRQCKKGARITSPGI